MSLLSSVTEEEKDKARRLKDVGCIKRVEIPDSVLPTRYRQNPVIAQHGVRSPPSRGIENSAQRHDYIMSCLEPSDKASKMRAERGTDDLICHHYVFREDGDSVPVLEGDLRKKRAVSEVTWTPPDPEVMGNRRKDKTGTGLNDVYGVLTILAVVILVSYVIYGRQ